MDDEQLLQFSPEQARQQLNDKQLERYNELKEESLTENLEENKAEKGMEAAEGLSVLRQSVQGDLTVEVRGIKFSTDITPQQFTQLAKLSDFEDRKIKDLEEEEVEMLKDSLLSILSDLSTDYSRADWDLHFGDSGLVTPAVIAGEVLSKIEDVMEQKKSR